MINFFGLIKLLFIYFKTVNKVYNFDSELISK